jgi:hypothetical protein
MQQHSLAYVWFLPVCMLVFGLAARSMINALKKIPDIRRKLLGSRDPSNLEVLATAFAIPAAVCLILMAIFLFRSAIFRV